MPKRTFIALVPPQEWIEVLHSAARSAFAADGNVRVVRPENLHATLVFLGDLEDSIASEVKGALEPALEGLRRPLLRASSPGRIERIGRSNALVVSLKDVANGALSELDGAIRAALRNANVPLDRAGPLSRPHITLARLRPGSTRSARGARRSASFDETRLTPWTAKEVSVVFSDLRPEGAVYSDGGRVAIG